MSSRLDIGVLCDPRHEKWPSMDLVGEMLLAEWGTTLSRDVEATEIMVSIPRIARRVPGLASDRSAFNADRIAARFAAYPARALVERFRHRHFHVVDHTYAHLVHALPASRTGVFCHDVDAFRCLISPELEPRPAWFRALARTTLAGLQSAAIVFHSTLPVRDELVAHGLVPRDRLVHAPYGVSSEFDAHHREDDGTGPVLAAIKGNPFVLHVGNELPRKRLDVVFEVFARLHARRPELRLVQQGATLSASQKDHVKRLGIEAFIVQPPRLPRSALAGLYRRAEVVLMPSESEGFGIPVIEAMACGAVVVASDIPVFREVGGDAAIYVPVAQVDAWVDNVLALFEQTSRPPARERRLAQAARFTWARHASTILDAYRALR